METIRNQAVQLETQAQAVKAELDSKPKQQTLLDQVKKEQQEEWEHLALAVLTH